MEEETIKKVYCKKCKKSWWPRVKKPAKCAYCGCQKYDTWEEPKEDKK